MCPVHRRKQLAKIKELLKEDADCRVISTQLIEAGVDIDFPTVYRAMSGIDSIAQAAGRCNREGKCTLGEVFVFRSSENYGKVTPGQRRNAEIGEMVMSESDDPLALSTVADFFHRLYFYVGDDGLDKKNILRSLEERWEKFAFPFRDVSEAFSIIENSTKDIIIPYDENAESTIEDARNTDRPWRYVRNLQGYTVSIYADEFRDLVSSHAIDTIGDRFHVLKNKDHYSEHTGLSSSKYNGPEMLFLMA